MRNRLSNYGFVTDSPLFDNGFVDNGVMPGDPMYDIHQRAMAQQAMEAGRPLTMAEMHGGQVQLFRQMGDTGEVMGKGKAFLIMLVGIAAYYFLVIRK